MRNFDYKLIHALDTIIKEQSFEKAAEELNITQSAISQRIKQLEQLIAQPVLVRSQPLSVTTVGQKLLRHFRQVKQLEHELISQILPDEVDDIVTISIAINADSLASWFIPAISPLLKKHAIELKLQVYDEARTRELLKKGEVYAALSSESEPITGCKVTKIADVDYILCATPKFRTKYFKKGLTKEALYHAPGIRFDPQDTMHIDYIYDHYDVSLGEYPLHTVGSSEAFVAMTVEGLACSLLPITQANEYLKQGILVDLAPENHLIRSMYWHSWVLERGIFKKVSEYIVKYGRQLLV